MKQKHTRRLIFLLIILFFMGSYLYSLPYYVSKPGMAKELDSIVKVENGYEGKGSFMLTTVRMGRANIYSYLMAHFVDYQEIYPLKAIRSEGETDEEYNVRQLQLMANSKTSAIEVAYKKAGLPVKYDYKGVYVLNVVKGMPAENKLKAGDRIFKVDDFEFASSDEFIQYVSNKKIGDEITLSFEREGTIQQVVLKVKSFKDQKEKVGIGISLVDDKEVIVEPPIKINTDEIGGPSAGLMFSLEIYNQLIEEDITKGYEIAGTGTISPDGEVGKIGGIDQKVVAAHKAGADIFFAPNEGGMEGSNYEIAVKTAKDIRTSMKIVPVDTFDDALLYLEKIEPKN